MSSELLLKAVADSTRLKILSSLMERPKFVEELAKELNITVSTACFHLKKLQAVGFVVSEKEQYFQTYSVNLSALNKSLIDIVSETKPVENDIYKEEVIKECFENGKLVKLPIQVKKRKIIYGELIKLFKKGTKYTERQANIIISDVYEDFIVLRKELEENGFLQRTSNGLLVNKIV